MSSGKKRDWNGISRFRERKLSFSRSWKLAHYANAAADIEFNFPFGFKELEGIHSRTDFDLKAHEKFSGRKFNILMPKNQNYVPYVVETSVGLDRMFLAVLQLKRRNFRSSTRTVNYLLW
jgi:glycyl-tRNA synthetase